MLKFCFKCNKYHPPESMVAKYNNKGRKVGIECRQCSKRQSFSFISDGNKSKAEDKKKIIADQT